VDANQVTTLRALLAPTGWLERTRAFAQGLRQATRSPGGLLLVGASESLLRYGTSLACEEHGGAFFYRRPL